MDTEKKSVVGMIDIFSSVADAFDEKQPIEDLIREHPSEAQYLYDLLMEHELDGSGTLFDFIGTDADLEDEYNPKAVSDLNRLDELCELFDLDGFQHHEWRDCCYTADDRYEEDDDGNIIDENGNRVNTNWSNYYIDDLERLDKFLLHFSKEK